MPHLLKNKVLEVLIDLPFENYQLSRFDWTGKIVEVKFKGISVSGGEIADSSKEKYGGKGFYNEFGIESPLGYEAAETGETFHKIGVGVLKKEVAYYEFHRNYEVIPAKFDCFLEPHTLHIKCHSQIINGYAYYLEKEISLLDNGFAIHYHLKNKGEKPIITDEYNHNFLCIDKDSIGKYYSLRFPFQLKPTKFGECVNPEGYVNMGKNEVNFLGNPNEQFFFSNLSGSEKVQANWEAENNKCKIGISETGDFQTNKVNLWGWKHVISPELFFSIHVDPGQSVAWTRSYKVYEIA